MYRCMRIGTVDDVSRSREDVAASNLSSVAVRFLCWLAIQRLYRTPFFFCLFSFILTLLFFFLFLFLVFFFSFSTEKVTHTHHAHGI